MMHTTKFTILVIEDDEPKLKAVQQFISAEFPKANVISSQSVTTAINSLVNTPVNLAIIDMSLPTYDFSADRAGGGNPQGFGGADILRFIESESECTKSVVLTQYEEFPAINLSGSRTLQDLSDEFHSELGDNFIGIIYYSGQHGEWRAQLRSIIKNVMEQVV